MPTPTDITTIIVNYRTPHLVQSAADTFRQAYPDVRLILVDNGSEDGSTSTINTLQKAHRNIDSILLTRNIYHGPAVNLALRKVTTPFFFLLDTDCTVRKGGFFEQMLTCFDNPRVYAAGKIRYVKRSGVPGHPRQANDRKGIPYVETWGGLFHCENCAALGVFSKGGASGNQIAAAAHAQHYRAISFPIQNFIEHLGGGTRRMFNMSAKPKHRQKASKWSAGKRHF